MNRNNKFSMQNIFQKRLFNFFNGYGKRGDGEVQYLYLSPRKLL